MSFVFFPPNVEGVVTEPDGGDGFFSVADHTKHVESLRLPATYDVFGHRFDVCAGVYHPHPCSSSVFMLRTLLRERPRLGRVLEIGCGSGVIGLSLLAHGLAEEVVMTDIDADCVRTAGANAVRLDLEQRATVQRGSLFEPVEGDRFNSIVFNMPLLHRSHGGARHIALDDPRGTVTREFLQRFAAFLEPAGQAYVTFSNLSDSSLLTPLDRRGALSLVSAEWVAVSRFWLMVYRLAGLESGCATR